MKTLREKVQEARLLDRTDALQRRLDAGFSLSRSEESELRGLARRFTHVHCPPVEPGAMDAFALFVLEAYDTVEIAPRAGDGGLVPQHRFIKDGRRGNASWIGQLAKERFGLGGGVKSIHSRVLKALTDSGKALSPGIEKTKVLTGTGRKAPEPWSEEL